ncbi:MAG: transporter substrate-binding domain-containing protein [Gammaproteobacteria bacterium]|nr:transporter substrate-binding domain-containing protein [Gammaproteobacteria bacterium]
MTCKAPLINKMLIVVSVFTLLVSTQLSAGTKIEQILIVSESWDKYTNTDGSGLFLDITRAIFEPQGIDLDIEFLPYKRALLRLQARTADAMFGTYSAEKEGKDYLITPLNPIDKEQTVAIYKPGTTDQWQGPLSLKDARLAWVRGYDYHENLPIKVNGYAEVANSEQGLSMLQAGRFDFFLDHAGELYDTIARTGFDTSDYQTNTVLEENVYMAFAKTSRGERLASLYDDGFNMLKRNGKLKAIFDKYNIVYPFPADSDS